MAEHICPPEHKHGATATCYSNHLCRCAPCRKSRADHAREVYRLQAYGTYHPGYVDAGPTRAHLAALREFGIGRAQVIRITGLDRRVLDGIEYGCYRDGVKLPPSVRVAVKSADRILAVPLDPDLRAPSALVPALGAQRRLQALTACGWTLSAMAEHTGRRYQLFARVLRSPRTTAGTDRMIRAMYEELWDAAPPADSPERADAARRAQARARARRWPRPLEWDDIDTDPKPSRPHVRGLGEPDLVAVELVCAGEPIGRHLTPAEVRLAVPILYRRRFSDALIGHYLGIDERTVLRVRYNELHLPGWPYGQTVKLTSEGEAA